jgi:hypothetical protein
MKKRMLLLGVVGILALTAAATATAAAYYVRVTPTNFLSIFNRGDNRPVSDWRLVTGPARPPLGRGSLELRTDDANAKQQHLETQQQGAALTSVNALGYFTYRHPESTGSPVAVAAINMEVYGTVAENPIGYATFVYEPVYNGVVASGSWQFWDAYRGGSALWWSTRDLRNPVTGDLLVCNPNGVNAALPVCIGKIYVPWKVLVAAAGTNAKVLSYGVDQGTGAPGIISNADALYIGAGGNYWGYDFEPGGGGADGDS